MIYFTDQYTYQVVITPPSDTGVGTGVDRYGYICSPVWIDFTTEDRYDRKDGLSGFLDKLKVYVVWDQPGDVNYDGARLWYTVRAFLGASIHGRWQITCVEQPEKLGNPRDREEP